MHQGVIRRSFAIMLAVALLLTTFAWGGGGIVEAKGIAGAVYALTNAPGGNAVAIFNRFSDGTLAAAGTVATGGLGTGGGLGSQGALVLSDNDRWLFAVDAGSNETPVFAVESTGLTLVDTVASGGTRPISLTVHQNLLYVLNDGGAGPPFAEAANITGFRVSPRGMLSPLAGSTRPLSAANPGPAQVEFSPDGRLLVVTEKATNLIDTFTVGQDGLATGPTSQSSAGATPFGFAFGRHNRLIVSEAFGGAVDQSALSSYDVANTGLLDVISPSVGTTETAACWVVVTKNGRYAYTTNAGSGSISGYRIAHDGSLDLLDADGRTGVTGAGSSPIDLTITNNSRYLYALTLAGGMRAVSAFQVQADGDLTALAGAGGLPASAVGITAR